MTNAKTTPKVSILIPVFNRKDYISECIQSALDQTFTDFEIVVVDNASDDGTWEICQMFEKYDCRVRIFRNNTNIGPVRNWKECFDKALGVFGKLLFSDDIIERTYLEKTVPFLEEKNIGLVFTSVNVGTNPNKIIHNAYRWHQRTGVYSSKSFLNDALFAKSAPVSPGAALFKMADLRSSLVVNLSTHKFKDYDLYGAGPDLLLYLLTACKYRKVGFVDEPLSFFRSHPGSLTDRYHEVFRLRYFQTKVWFANKYNFKSFLARLLVKGWILSILTKKIITFNSFSNEYGIKNCSLVLSLYYCCVKHQ